MDRITGFSRLTGLLSQPVCSHLQPAHRDQSERRALWDNDYLYLSATNQLDCAENVPLS